MPNEMSFDMVVVGAGPGGYVAAIRAAQLGFKTACIERESTLGGTCLNVGCIPSKALLDSSELYAQARDAGGSHGFKVAGLELDLPTMLRRKDGVVRGLTKGIEGLFRKNGVEWLRGNGRLAEPGRLEVADASGNVTLVNAKHILLATGSSAIPFPGVPFDEDRILSSTGALAIPEVPNHLIVIGGGVIGLELGSVWLRLGAKVTVLELLPTILTGFDEEIVKLATRIFTKQGFEFRTGIKVTGIQRQDDSVAVGLDGGETITGDRVLVSIGRRPNTEGLGAKEAGLELGPRGAIVVRDHYRTNLANVYAVGDVIGGKLLAHEAEEEGVAAVETAAGKVGHVNYDAIPGIVYTFPEIAMVGQTEAQLQNEGREYKVGKFPHLALGRARAMGEAEGLVKVLADAKTDRVLGVHILGPRASDVIAEAALAIEFQSSAEDIAISVHAHPTFPEALKEAALAVGGRSIHY